MTPRSPLGRRQTRRLEQLRALGVCTDDSLSAFMLEHVDDPAAVLDLWARDHGLRVVPAVEGADQLRDAAEALRRAANALEQVAGPEVPRLRVVGARP